MSKFNNLFKQLVSEDVNSGSYAILYGRTVYPIGSRMPDCPFEENGQQVDIRGIDKVRDHVFNVHLGTVGGEDEDEHTEGYTHTVNQSQGGAIKDETGNNLNIKIVTIK